MPVNNRQTVPLDACAKSPPSEYARRFSTAYEVSSRLLLEHPGQRTGWPFRAAARIKALAEFAAARDERSSRKSRTAPLVDGWLPILRGHLSSAAQAATGVWRAWLRRDRNLSSEAARRLGHEQSGARGGGEGLHVPGGARWRLECAETLVARSAARFHVGLLSGRSERNHPPRSSRRRVS